ncbi:hypothetical protein [uncultured Winogradskyella sp.]|uniref:hypothetical protein n=1 Tax=uncultured Winogradskyella sp. TaxID=395353 RepID=UPI00261041B1|nr:hypothetical protein [uncultured Winogradskyella sp.]
MKVFYYITFISLFLICSSFQITQFKSKDFLFQKWVYEDFENNTMILKSKRNYKRDKFGIEFSENGTLERKQNANWCGTGQIEFEIVSGTWKHISESDLEIKYKDWRGSVIDTLQIVQLTKSKLALKIISN